MLHGSHFLLLIIEETDNQRKTGERIIQQIKSLYGVIKRLTEQGDLSEWLNRCTNKPKELNINPSVLLNNKDYKTNWDNCGGLAIGIVPKITPSIKNKLKHSLVVKTGRYNFEIKPYIMIVKKSDIMATRVTLTLPLLLFTT